MGTGAHPTRVCLCVCSCVCALSGASGSGSASKRPRPARRDTPDDKDVRQRMLQVCPLQMQAAMRLEKPLSVSARLAQAPAFKINSELVELPPVESAVTHLTLDFACTLVGSVTNQQLVGSIMDSILRSRPSKDPSNEDKRRAALKDRCVTYFNTLRRTWKRIQTGKVGDERQDRSYARRRARVSSAEGTGRDSHCHSVGSAGQWARPPLLSASGIAVHVSLPRCVRSLPLLCRSWSDANRHTCISRSKSSCA